MTQEDPNMMSPEDFTDEDVPLPEPGDDPPKGKWQLRRREDSPPRPNREVKPPDHLEEFRQAVAEDPDLAPRDETPEETAPEAERKGANISGEEWEGGNFFRALDREKGNARPEEGKETAPPEPPEGVIRSSATEEVFLINPEKRDLRFHPFSGVFDLLQDMQRPGKDGEWVAKEWDDFHESVKLHGSIDLPIVLFQGMILDGRNRWLAAKKHGLVCPAVLFKGTTEEAKALVSRRELRRHQSKLKIAEGLCRLWQIPPTTKLKDPETKQWVGGSFELIKKVSALSKIGRDTFYRALHNIHSAHEKKYDRKPSKQERRIEELEEQLRKERNARGDLEWELIQEKGSLGSEPSAPETRADSQHGVTSEEEIPSGEEGGLNETQRLDTVPINVPSPTVPPSSTNFTSSLFLPEEVDPSPTPPEPGDPTSWMNEPLPSPLGGPPPEAGTLREWLLSPDPRTEEEVDRFLSALSLESLSRLTGVIANAQ